LLLNADNVGQASADSSVDQSAKPDNDSSQNSASPQELTEVPTGIHTIGPDGYVEAYQECPDSRESRIIPGIDAVVSPAGQANRVRNEPGRSSSILGLAEPSTKLHALEGPVCSDSMTWWRVSFADNPSFIG